jgi:PAS domain S-box-containing protein
MPTAPSPGTGAADELRDLDEATVRALVDAAPDGILLADDTGNIVFANRQTEKMFGFGPEELLGHSVDDLLPEQMREVHRAHRTRYKAEPRVRPMGAGLLLRGRRSDGTEFPVEISLSPLRTDSGLQVVAVVRDVSERIEAEERIQRAEQHVRIVEDRERIARDLHDIVIQKLFAAGMTVQGVAAGGLDADRAQRLNRVVDDLDDTIREIRSVIFGLQSEARDVPGVRAAVLRVLDDQREALGFEARLRFDGPVDTMNDLVAAELLPAVREAVSNVARHADASSMEVDIQCGDFVTLRVLDDGRGLTGTASGGNGIRNLSERAGKLGGRCTVSARPDGGTMLEWRVPNVP